MKILTKHLHLRPLVYILFALGLLVILFFPYIFAFSFRAHMILFVSAGLLISTPWAHRRTPLEEKHERFSFIKSLGCTLLLEIALMCAFYTICHLTAFTIPISIQPFPLLPITAHILLTAWGVFPWGAVVLLAVGLSYIAYLQKQPGDISTLLRPLIKNVPADTISLTADVTIKIAITFSFGCTFALIAMECIGLLSRFFKLPLAYGTRLDVMLVILLILQWIRDDFIENRLRWLLKRHISPGYIVTGSFLLVILFFLLIGTLIGFLSPIFTPTLMRFITFAPSNWSVVWLIFTGIWWLGWVPLTAGTIAYLWRGYRIRTMILCTLFLPTAITMLEITSPNWSATIGLNTNLWNLLPALVSLVLLTGLFLRTSVLAFIEKATLPTVWRYYQRKSQLFLKVLLQAMIGIMSFYWAGGIYIPSLLYCMVIFSAVMFIFTASISVFKILVKKQ